MNVLLAYDEFVSDKARFEYFHGFDVQLEALHPILLPHQRAIVRWALTGGRRAIFAAFGLGKSVMQLEIMRQILERDQEPVLIVCPLGVRQEFARDARELLNLDTTFVRTTAAVDGPGIYLSNYESLRDGKLDPRAFRAVSLDEAAVLRSYGSKTYQEFMPLFADVPYRFVATATPSPNRHKELIHYAAYLGIMPTGDALTRWFQRDSTKANHLTLYPHREREFWLWLNTWATFVQRPSDLGFSDDGYELPELDVRFHEVAPDDVDRSVFERDGRERDVVKGLQRKWAEHEQLTDRMADIVREHKLNTDSITEELLKTLGTERVEASGDSWVMACNDTVREAGELETGSVDLVVTSIPFSNHYAYSNQYEDFGSTDSNAHFWAQMDYLTAELHRVLAPGRIYCCHVKDRILFGNVTGTGVPTVSPFHAEAIAHGIKHGFDYMGMITVVTDVVRENNQTYRLGWSEMCKDGSKMGVGSPEYVLLFHRPQTDRSRGYADTPVAHSKDEYSRARWQTDAHAFWRSSGDRHLTPDELAHLPIDQVSRTFTEHTLQAVYDYEQHVRIGERLDEDTHLPATFMALAPGSWMPDVWTDINRMRTLNTEQSQQRKMLHVCPLQFDIVDRLIERFSNPGDLVYDPFAGLGTVPLRAVRAGRRGRGVELNADYWRDGCAYLRAQDHELALPTLFDLEPAA